MKYSQFFFATSAIYLARIVSESTCLMLGGMFALAGAIALWREP